MGLPTLGPLMLGSMINQDVWLASDIILILGGLTVIGTLISDLVLVAVDPRIKLS
jgi:peptide/nickel transport system permease protein